MAKKKVALIVGHCCTGDKGACSSVVPELSEYAYNSKLCIRIKELLDARGKVESVVIRRKTKEELKAVNTQMTTQAIERASLFSEQDSCNATKPDFAISFHANASENAISAEKLNDTIRLENGDKIGIVEKVKRLFDTPDGAEILIYAEGKESPKGRAMAEILLPAICKALGVKKRSIIPITKVGQRGYWTLKRIIAPVVLLEPFFISDTEDCLKAQVRFENFAFAMAESIEKIADEVI